MLDDIDRPLPQLHVVTRIIEPQEDLLGIIGSSEPLLFQRLGKGLIGIGAAVMGRFTGANRMSDAANWWRQLCSRAQIDNPELLAGTGLVGFGSFTFSAHSGEASVLIVPREVVGTDGHLWWRTTIGGPEEREYNEPTTKKGGRESQKHWIEGSQTSEGFIAAVETALEKIHRGEISKVVLARDITLRLDGEPSWSDFLNRLAGQYPDTFVFCIDGLFGASPETLASVRGQLLELQVLAGSIERGSTPAIDATQQQSLATSYKDLDEHRYAVENVVASLREKGIVAVADEMPSTIKLTNLWHLGTRVIANLPDGWTSLHTIEALHPTAAVGGVPTAEALELIDSLEPFDRGRYAGPVGWVDDRGNGDWAIALRCGQYSAGNNSITAFAGAGVVRESQPEKELLEVSVKLRPIIDAVGATQGNGVLAES